MNGCNNKNISVPDININLPNGCKVRLGRFDDTVWILSYGWYTWGGNRPFCGWYLTDEHDPTQVKPLQATDIYDIYLVET